MEEPYAFEEAGYADKIASGIDRIKGDYSTLPREMQLLFIKLRATAKRGPFDDTRAPGGHAGDGPRFRVGHLIFPR